MRKLMWLLVIVMCLPVFAMTGDGTKAINQYDIEPVLNGARVEGYPLAPNIGIARTTSSSAHDMLLFENCTDFDLNNFHIYIRQYLLAGSTSWATSGMSVEHSYISGNDWEEDDGTQLADYEQQITGEAISPGDTLVLYLKFYVNSSQVAEGALVEFYYWGTIWNDTDSEDVVALDTPTSSPDPETQDKPDYEALQGKISGLDWDEITVSESDIVNAAPGDYTAVLPDIVLAEAGSGYFSEGQLLFFHEDYDLNISSSTTFSFYTWDDGDPVSSGNASVTSSSITADGDLSLFIARDRTVGGRYVLVIHALEMELPGGTWTGPDEILLGFIDKIKGLHGDEVWPIIEIQ